MRKVVSLGGIWIALAAICWALACACAASMTVPGKEDRISYRDPDGSTSFAVVEDMREYVEDGRITAWTQRYGRSVSNSTLSASAQADVLWFDGNPADIWDLEMINGFLPQNDSGMCAIDDQTAGSIFGSVNIIGCEITVDGATLTVSGVFKLPSGLPVLGSDPGRGIAICPADASASDLTITAWEASVYGAGMGNGANISRGWFSSAGVRAPSTVYDRGQQQRMFGQAARLVGWVFAIVLCLQLALAAWQTFKIGTVCGYRLRRNRVVPIRVSHRITLFSWLASLALLVAGAACLLLANIDAYIPPEYLPTQWSDLSFWPNMLTSYFQNIAQMRQYPMLRPDAARESLKTLCLLFSFGSFAFMFHAMRAQRAVKPYRFPKEMPVIWAISIGCVFVGFFLAKSLGFTATIPAGVVPIPCLVCAIPPMLKALAIPQRIPRWAFHSRKTERRTITYENKGI